VQPDYHSSGCFVYLDRFGDTFIISNDQQAIRGDRILPAIVSFCVVFSLMLYDCTYLFELGLSLPLIQKNNF